MRGGRINDGAQSTHHPRSTAHHQTRKVCILVGDCLQGAQNGPSPWEIRQPMARRDGINEPAGAHYELVKDAEHLGPRRTLYDLECATSQGSFEVVARKGLSARKIFRVE